MEKIDLHWIRRRGLFKLRKDGEPKPFPGSHPLRVAAFVSYKLPGSKEEKAFAYFGKPSVDLSRRLAKLFNLSGTVMLWDLDRAGPISHHIGDLPMSLEHVTHSNIQRRERLVQYYRFNTTASLPVVWIRDYSLEPIRLERGGKTSVVYGPVEGSIFWQEHFTGYRQWLDANMPI